MTFPNYPEKHQLASLLNPGDIVAYRRHLGRLPRIEYPEGLLFCLERGLPKLLRRRVPVRYVGRMFGELYMVKKPALRVLVLSDFGGGAPIVGELAEEFIALGVSRIALITWGGALQPDLKPGDIVVCDRAIRDEGLSHHYLPPARYVEASGELVAHLAKNINMHGYQPRIGATWTTDAPYRETLEEVREYQAEGVKCVEMESAGLFAICQARGVEVVSAVVIMDSLANYRWEVPNNLEDIQKGLAATYLASIETLSQKS